MSPLSTQCDGYLTSYGGENPTPSKLALVEPYHPATIVLPNPVYGTRSSDEERRCFDYFLKRTAPQLSGFWDSDFWSCLILRATHHQSAIRHAVLALGSLHERFEAGDNSVVNPIWNKGDGGFALEQYNRAIQQLVKPVSDGQQAVDVCLIACVLFACFEVRPSSNHGQLFGEDREKGYLSANAQSSADRPVDTTRPLWIGPLSHPEWSKDFV